MTDDVGDRTAVGRVTHAAPLEGNIVGTPDRRYYPISTTFSRRTGTVNVTCGVCHEEIIEKMTVFTQEEIGRVMTGHVAERHST